MRAKVFSWVTSLALNLGLALSAKAVSTIEFTATSYTVAESAGAVPLTVQRTGDSTTVAGVDYTTADGTATNGLKYISTNGTLTFGAGQTNQTIVVPILNNGLVDGAQNFRVVLGSPTGDALLGSRTNVSVSITDNDFGIQFQFSTNSVSEGAGVVLIGVVRGDDGTNAVTVDYATANLTATSGLDYTGATNTLAFAPQERFKFVSVPILNNGLKEAMNKTFRVTLSNPAGATLGIQKTVTVMIVDNDQRFQFETHSYFVSEDADVVRLAVLRGTDDTNSPVTVDFATTDLTAINGLDYTGTTNTLTFAPGENLKMVTIPILNDGMKEPTKSFRVTLSNPAGIAVLGSPTSATVTIFDNDPGVGFELSSYSVWENAGAITVTVLRGNDLALGPVTVDYATSNLSAVAGTDYQAVSGTLAFGENETIKTLTIPILRDALVTNDTSFKVTLSNPTGGATLGRSSTTVSILDMPGLGTYRTVAPPFDTSLAIRRDGGFDVVTWSGGGQLQRADQFTGPWQMLTNASSPYAVESALPTTFYRVTRPRSLSVYVPSSYDRQKPAPLVILLHPYGANADFAEGGWQFRPLAEARGFLYCVPDSPADSLGSPFWNGTDSCCDFFDTGRDDASYLRAVIEEIGRQFAVDRKRIYLIGNSNGGFLAYRMACQSADLIAGIVSRAGATFLDPSRCAPSEPVNILHIHGTADVTVYHAGGALTTLGGLPSNMPAFPGALQTVQSWAGYNGARDPVTEPELSLDLDLNVPGLDTAITRYTSYLPGGAVELWSITGGTHFLNPTPEFAPRVIEWLLAHPKP